MGGSDFKTRVGCGALMAAGAGALWIMGSAPSGKSGEALPAAALAAAAGFAIAQLLSSSGAIAQWAREKNGSYWACYGVALFLCATGVVNVPWIVGMVGWLGGSAAWGVVEAVGDRLHTEPLAVATFFWLPLTLLCWALFMILWVPFFLCVQVPLAFTVLLGDMLGWGSVFSSVLYAFPLSSALRNYIFPWTAAIARRGWPAAAVLIHDAFIALPRGAAERMERTGQTEARVRTKLDLAIAIAAGVLALLSLATRQWGADVAASGPVAKGLAKLRKLGEQKRPIFNTPFGINFIDAAGRQRQAERDHWAGDYQGAAEGATEVIECGLADRGLANRARLLRGWAFYRMGELDKAMGDAQALIGGSAKPQGCALAGVVNLARNDHTQALRMLDEAIRAMPEAGSYYVDRGEARRLGGDHAAAIRDCEKAAELNAKDPEAWWERSPSLVAQGKPAKALEMADRGLELMPKGGSSLGSVRGLAYKAEALWALGRQAEAERSLNEAKALDPRDEEAKRRDPKHAEIARIESVLKGPPPRASQPTKKRTSSGDGKTKGASAKGKSGGGAKSAKKGASP